MGLPEFWTMSLLLLPVSLGWQFYHFGDPQIGMSDFLSGGEGGWLGDTSRFFEAVQMANRGNASHIAMSGDLVHVFDNGTQLSGFHTVYPDQIEGSAGLVPGNHDVDNVVPGEETIRQLIHYRAIFGSDYTATVIHNALFVHINAPLLIQEDPYPLLRSEQEIHWRWLERALDEGSRNPEVDHIFLVMHHPPFLEREDEDEEYFNWPLEQRKRLLRFVRRYGVANLLCGHTHTTTSICSPDGMFDIYTVAGTAVVFDDNGYGYRVWSVNGNSLSQRFERLPEQLQSNKPCRTVNWEEVHSEQKVKHPYICRPDLPKAF